jgi:hypothetical protein
MKRPVKRYEPRNPDGSFKSLGQLINQRLTILQYGQLLAAQQKAQSTR